METDTCGMLLTVQNISDILVNNTITITYTMTRQHVLECEKGFNSFVLLQ